MSSPAKDAREKVIQQYPNAVVHSRGRNSLTMYDPVLQRYILDAQLGMFGWHTAAGSEVDTAWQPDTGAWQYKMLLADYNAFARSVFNAGDVIQYVEPITGQSVTFQPLGLNWVDNVTDSRQQIAIPQAVTATVDDDRLYWQDGYGPGRHFEWQTQTARLQKLLILDSAAALPAPTVSNSYLEIEFIVKYSADVLVFIDGQEWDKQSKTTTASSIEFRNAAGKTLWYFRSPKAWDSNGMTVSGLIQVRRQGANLYSAVRFLKSFIDSAVFPVYLDDTVDEQVGASADDAWYKSDGTFRDTTSGDQRFGDATILEIPSIGSYARMQLSIPQGSTITSAYMTYRATQTRSGTTCNAILSAADEDNATNPSSASDAVNRTRTTASALWSNIATWTQNVNYTSADVSAIIQEVVQRAGWVSDNYILLFTDNNGSSASAWRDGYSYDASTTYAPKLHVEYTVTANTLSINIGPETTYQTGVRIYP